MPTADSVSLGAVAGAPPHAPGFDWDPATGVLALRGAWGLADLEHLHAALAALPVSTAARAPRVDGGALASIDTAAAMVLLRALARLGADPSRVELDGFAPNQRRTVELVRERLPQLDPSPPPAPRGILGRVGASAMSVGSLVRGHVAFLGRVLVELVRVVRHPAALRRRELGAQFGQVCVDAIPVVALVTFLIGMIVAYLLGEQAAQYGANIYVVDGVALGMVREFSPLIVATIVAGRSGASFTAQLGTMRLTEEIDAIRVLGLSPEQVLVVPRVLALALSLPLLVFVGNLAGGTGAAIVADLMLGITPHTFVDRVHGALEWRHYAIGLAKGPVFALFIAVIGCRMGIDASRDTRSIGVNTTSTVVQSIVAVILLDALFAVVLQEVGW